VVIDPLFDSCAGSYIFDDVPPGTAGYSTANIAFVCHGLGAQDVTINFRVNGVTLPTYTLVRHDGNSPWRALCSPADVAGAESRHVETFRMLGFSASVLAGGMTGSIFILLHSKISTLTLFTASISS
jgi:hypothetical protein